MNSTYAPWHDDEKFRMAYDAVLGHTFVDQYKCYELWEQLGQLREVDGDILEVGVWRGGTGVLMARRAQQLGLDAVAHLCDTFEGVAHAGEADPWYRGGEHADTSAATVQDLADRVGVEVDVRTGIFPDDTAAGLDGIRLRLVHIDVDVHESARLTLAWAWPRLSPGGVVIWMITGRSSARAWRPWGVSCSRPASPEVVSCTT